jgi:hypothetical protein
MAVCLNKETHENGDPIVVKGGTSTEDCSYLSDEIFELIRDIKDPEREETLEALNVVQDNLISVLRDSKHDTYHIRIEFVPTVQHCSLANTIGKEY